MHLFQHLASIMLEKNRSSEMKISKTRGDSDILNSIVPWSVVYVDLWQETIFDAPDARSCLVCLVLGCVA